MRSLGMSIFPVGSEDMIGLGSCVDVEVCGHCSPGVDDCHMSVGCVCVGLARGFDTVEIFCDHSPHLGGGGLACG